MWLRPISLLTSFSEIFEKLMYARLIEHIETNNMLAQEHFGFRSHSMTEQAGFSLIDSILYAQFILFIAVTALYVPSSHNGWGPRC
jgi:hypothetical protein